VAATPLTPEHMGAATLAPSVTVTEFAKTRLVVTASSGAQVAVPFEGLARQSSADDVAAEKS